MAQAQYTIGVQFHGVWRHRYRGQVLAFSFDCEPGVIHLAFEE